MPVKLDQPSSDISIDQLKDGQIAEITKWGGYNSYKGLIVQRYKNILLVVGEHSGSAFDKVYEISYLKDYRVKVLPNNSTLTIVDN